MSRSWQNLNVIDFQRWKEFFGEEAEGDRRRHTLL